MDYKVLISEDAKEDFERFISYILLEKKNIQAASSLIEDYDKTIEKLSFVAGNLKFCDNEKLKMRGYKSINFLKHRYFMLFRVENDCVYVDRIYHMLQDYETKMI